MDASMPEPVVAAVATGRGAGRGAGGRGRGKAKGKGKKAMKVMKSASAAAPAGESALAIIPKAKNSSGGLRKKVLEECSGKELKTALAEKKSGLSVFDAHVQEADALEKAVRKQVDVAQAEFAAAKSDVEKALESEMKSAGKMSDLKKKKAALQHNTDESRKALFEAQKKLTTLEVYQLSHTKIKALEEARRAATKAAEDAKKALMDQRQKEKEAMEETRRRLQEARAATKRPAPVANGNVD